MDFKKDNMSANNANQNRGDNRHAERSVVQSANTALSHTNTQQESRNSKGLSFVFRKSEKLTTALYMVTDIMSEREPMKWKMRETAVELMSGVTLAVGANPTEKMSALADVLKKAERLISFLDIAEASRLLSAMNASVLKKEYTVLKSSIEYEWTKIFDQDRMVFTDKFFAVPEENIETRLIEQPASREEVVKLDNVSYDDKRHERKDVVTIPRETGGRMLVQPKRQVIQEVAKEVIGQEIKIETPRHEPIQIHPARMHGTLTGNDTFVKTQKFDDDLLPERNKVDAGKSDRRTIILALIKQKPALGVKDFVKSIPDVSEKTIQRELLAMVSEGLLVKKGERRWSTYSLPSQ